MEYVALVLFVAQFLAWFVLPSTKTGKITEESMTSIGDETVTAAA